MQILGVQLFQVGFHRDDGLVVGLQISFIASQKITALARFCVQHALQQAVGCIAGLLPVAHGLNSILGAFVPHFVDANEQQCGQQGEWQADGHRAAFAEPVPRVIFEGHAGYSDNGGELLRCRLWCARSGGAAQGSARVCNNNDPGVACPSPERG